MRLLLTLAGIHISQADVEVSRGISVMSNDGKHPFWLMCQVLLRHLE